VDLAGQPADRGENKNGQLHSFMLRGCISGLS
jgi:hypothetical protein